MQPDNATARPSAASTEQAARRQPNVRVERFFQSVFMFAIPQLYATSPKSGYQKWQNHNAFVAVKFFGAAPVLSNMSAARTPLS